VNREPAPHSSAKIRLAGRLAAWLACSLAAACIISFCLDSRYVRQAAQNIIADARNDNEKVLALANWVQQNKGTRENDDYFILRSLRATPLQVLQGGGGPKEDMVALNAAAVFIAAGLSREFPDGVALARETIRSGRALKKLDLLIQKSKSFG